MMGMPDNTFFSAGQALVYPIHLSTIGSFLCLRWGNVLIKSYPRNWCAGLIGAIDKDRKRESNPAGPSEAAVDCIIPVILQAFILWDD